MPGFDRTGPMGRGPMSGRGQGMCAEYGSPYPVRGAFFGWRRGGGRGLRHQYCVAGAPGWGRMAWGAPPSPYGYAMSREEEVGGLKNHAQRLQEELDIIQARIKELEKTAEA